MKYLTIILTLLFSINLCAQENNLVNDSKAFISSVVKIYEPNSIHKKQSMKIEKMFQDALKAYPDYKLDKCKLTDLLIDNAETLYEDSQDFYRHEMRRSIIFSLFAMSVPREKSDFFFQLSENSLKNIEQKESGNYDSYAGILILQMIVKQTNRTLKLNDINMIKQDFIRLRTLIPKQKYDTGLRLIEAYKNKLQY